MTKPFDPTKPVQTRDGRPVRIVCTNAVSYSNERHLLGLITSSPSGVETPLFFRQDGQMVGGTPEGRTNLVNVVEKTKIYRNVYANENSLAKRYNKINQIPTNPRIGVIEETYEDGELVSVRLLRKDEL